MKTERKWHIRMKLCVRICVSVYKSYEKNHIIVRRLFMWTILNRVLTYVTLSTWNANGLVFVQCIIGMFMCISAHRPKHHPYDIPFNQHMDGRFSEDFFESKKYPFHSLQIQTPFSHIEKIF